MNTPRPNIWYRIRTRAILSTIDLRRCGKAMETQEIECCIRGYHVYQDIWEAAVDEELVCRPERSNAHDRYAVARFLLPLVFACCTPFTAALASAMAEGDSSADRGPEGSGKTRGATWK